MTAETRRLWRALKRAADALEASPCGRAAMCTGPGRVVPMMTCHRCAGLHSVRRSLRFHPDRKGEK